MLIFPSVLILGQQERQNGSWKLVETFAKKIMGPLTSSVVHVKIKM